MSDDGKIVLHLGANGSSLRPCTCDRVSEGLDVESCKGRQGGSGQEAYGIPTSRCGPCGVCIDGGALRAPRDGHGLTEGYIGEGCVADGPGPPGDSGGESYRFYHVRCVPLCYSPLCEAMGWGLALVGVTGHSVRPLVVCPPDVLF